MSDKFKEFGTEVVELLAALYEIAVACEKPFGKDARRARQIARDALSRWDDFAKREGAYK